MNRCFEEINGNKYLTLVPTNESKEKIKKYEELWIKVIDLVMSVTEKSDDYDAKSIKIRLDSVINYISVINDRNSCYGNSY